MSQDFVKYGFALLDSKDGKVVRIDSLSRETSSSHKFYCPHCHREMYPTFGPIQVSHFRHNGEKCKPDNLPSESDAEELRECCSRHFDSAKKEMVFTDPNGNSVSFKCTDKYTSYWMNEYESNFDKDYGKCFHLIPNGNSFWINNRDSNTPSHVHHIRRI